MDLEAWAGGLLQRLLAVIEALDAPDHRAADQASGSGGDEGASWLLTDQSMFRRAAAPRPPPPARQHSAPRTQVVSGAMGCRFSTPCVQFKLYHCCRTPAVNALIISLSRPAHGTLNLSI